MNEPPGARLRVGLSGLTMAEYFRDAGPGRAALHRQHLPLRPGGLRGVGAARPHAERRRLPADARDRDGPAAGAHHVDAHRLGHVGAGDLRARRRPHRPGAGEHVRPPRLDHGARRARSWRRASTPRSTRSTRPRARSQPGVVSDEHYEVATRVQQILQRYKDLQDIIAILGMDELTDEDKLVVAARAQDRALPLAAELRRRAVHRHARASTSSSRTRSAASGRSSTAKHDELPESAFYMVGTIEEAVEKARQARGGRRVGEPWPTRTRSSTSRSSRRTARRSRARRRCSIVPGAAGEIGVLARHAPLVATLKAGSTRVHLGRRRGARVRDRARASSRSSTIVRSRSSTTRSSVKEIDDDARARRSSRRRRRSSRRSRRASRRPTAGSSSSASGTPRTSSPSPVARPAGRARARSPASQGRAMARARCFCGDLTWGSLPQRRSRSFARWRSLPVRSRQRRSRSVPISTDEGLDGFDRTRPRTGRS